MHRKTLECQCHQKIVELSAPTLSQLVMRPYPWWVVQTLSSKDSSSPLSLMTFQIWTKNQRLMHFALCSSSNLELQVRQSKRYNLEPQKLSKTLSTQHSWTVSRQNSSSSRLIISWSKFMMLMTLEIFKTSILKSLLVHYSLLSTRLFLQGYRLMKLV